MCTIINYNQIILNALKAWLEWVEAGMPDSEVFKHQGLCSNVMNYTRKFVSEANPINVVIYLECMFSADGLSTLLPFNMKSAGQPSYTTEVTYKTLHLNKDRMAWVLKTIKRLEETNNA